MEQPLPLLIGDDNVDFNSTGDKQSFPVPCPMKISAIGLVICNSDTGDATIKFDRRVTAGSDTNRVSAGLGTLLKPASSNIGKVLYEKLDSSTDLILNAGDEIVINVTAENVSANAFVRPFIEYFRLSENKVNESSALASL